MTTIHYLIRSRVDGRYLTARFQTEDGENSYLLLFKQDFDALSYLNTHAQDVSDHFAVESLPEIQLKSLLQRWGFKGVGLVGDPLEPRINFLTYA